MKKWVFAAAAAMGLAGAADAAVITLQDVSADGDSFRFGYQATLGPDEGLETGQSFYVFDFFGYVDGSGFAPDNFTVATEAESGVVMLPSRTDSAELANLVFTYNGPTIRAEDGPLDALNLGRFGALSTVAQTTVGSFTTYALKNNPPEAAGTPTIQVGLVQVPAVPEPASWAMMIGGFGLIGAAMRRRSTATSTALA